MKFLQAAQKICKTFFFFAAHILGINIYIGKNNKNVDKVAERTGGEWDGAEIILIKRIVIINMVNKWVTCLRFFFFIYSAHDCA